MPSFTIQSQDLVTAGSIVEALIGPSRALVDAMQTKGQSIHAPEAVAALAMIDTGSAGSVIREHVAKALGIHPVGVAQMSTPSTQTPVAVDVYNVSISFRNQGVTIPHATVVQAALGGQHLDALIGRDILRHSVFWSTWAT